MTKHYLVFPIISVLFVISGNAHAAQPIGEWCENGGPYVCYPPIDNKNDEYICTDGTSITKAGEDSIEFETRQTVHFYSQGIKNGNTKPHVVKNIFRRASQNQDNAFELIETTGGEEIRRELKISDDTLQLFTSKKQQTSEEPAIVSKINYQRCSDDPRKKTFYTALVDCGGSGDYITGVPAVVNNPLMWDLGESSNIDKSKCQVAAKCWGGGWVAFAKSAPEDQSDKEAFGAACGTKNRQEAKQQAINSCRESGGTNCLAEVVSGYDDGSNELNDHIHKGEYLESCSQGECAIISKK